MEDIGVINYLKPAGMTSHDCVYMLRRVTGIKRIGHTGTLDPMAVGVLPLCLGNATRIMDYLDMDKKCYRCEMILGIVTDTWDIWGSVIEDNRQELLLPDRNAIEKAFQNFTGNIYQQPPFFSSVRIAGKRMYEYAREGKEVEAGKRPVIIYNIEIQKYDEAKGRLVFDLTCSKGTYVRSICHRAGELLGCGASMSFLLRTATGIFKLSDSITSEGLTLDWRKHLLPVDYPLINLGKLTIHERRAKWFCNGGYLVYGEAAIEKEPLQNGLNEHINIRKGLEQAYCVYAGSKFLGVAIYDENERIFKADKVFCR